MTTGSFLYTLFRPRLHALIARSPRSSKIDPHHEIAHIRQSLASLEAYIVRSGTGPAYSSGPSNSVPPQGPPTSDAAEKLTSDAHETSNKSVPGMLNSKAQGGLYAGPTSNVTHLLSFKSPEQRESRDADNSGDDSTRSSDEGTAPHLNDQTRSYDNDLLELLPQLHIIDGECQARYLSRFGPFIDIHYLRPGRFLF